MMENSLVCAQCSSNTRTLFEAPNKKEYCAECMRFRYPPYMVLMQYTSGNMYNVETGQYESFRDPKELEMCGWEVRMIMEMPNDTLMIYLEYYGDYKCGRCGDYEWTLAGGNCISSVCMDHREKLPPEKRFYPNRASFYLTWKYGGEIK